MARPTIPSHRDLDVDNRRVFVRVDFNVPLGEDGTVRDDTRIVASLPTLKSLISRDAKMVIASHLGRPKGGFEAKYAMEPVAGRLAELLSCEVRVPADEVVGDAARKLVADLRPRQIVLLQNLRFEPGETKNDAKFSQALASLCDVYVNDAFGASHRAHASVVGLPRLVRARGAGELLEAEIKALSRLVDAPEHPFVAIVGGAKVSDKLSVMMALVERLRAGDALVIGGAMANTFLAAGGAELGGSLQERDRYADCRVVLDKARARDVTVVLPTDLRTGDGIEAKTARTVGASTGLGAGTMALDIGPDTAERIATIVRRAKMVLWNGPMGLFENPAFADGTLVVAKALAECAGFTVVGGGDSVAAISEAGIADRIGHVSTGGGASLEFLEGEVLPGVAALLAEDE